MEIQRQLTIDRIREFLEDIEQLENFLRNVHIPISKRNGQKTFKYQSQALQLSVNKHKIKVFKIWKQFITRLNDFQLGITYFHLEFIKISLRFYLYKQAKSIIYQPGLPISINLLDYKQYLRLQAIFFIQIKDYEKAYTVLNRAKDIQLGNLDQNILILQQLTLIKKIVGLQITKEKYNQNFQGIKRNHSDEVTLIIANQQKFKIIQFELHLFYSFCENQELNQKEIECLKQKGLIKLYNKGKKSKIISLKQQIKNQIKLESLYRIKCHQMKNIQIGQFNVIKKINNPQSLYKYDHKNQVMYFNHKMCTQQEIDRLLHKALQMQKILNSKYRHSYETPTGRFIRKF